MSRGLGDVYKRQHEIADAVEKSIINSVDNVYDILVHVEPAGKCQTGEKFGVDKDMV